jgi:hypothetical protein
MRETPTEEMIAQLQTAREDLERKKKEIERKIENFRSRRRGESQETGRGR